MGPGKKVFSSGTSPIVAVLIAVTIQLACPGGHAQSVGAMAESVPASQPGAAAELARYMPIWATAYLEVKNLHGLVDRALSGHREPSAGWKSTPGSSTRLTRWLEQANAAVKATLGVSGRHFVEHLLGEHFAFAWGGPNLPDQFGLVCRLRDREGIENLLREAKAKRIGTRPGEAVRRYKLPSAHFRAAVFRNTLILATIGGAGDTGMYYSIIDLVTGTSDKCLSSHVAFRRMCRRVRPDYDAFVALIPHDRTIDAKSLSRRGAVLVRELNRINYLAAGANLRSGQIDISVLFQPSEDDGKFRPARALDLDRPVLELINSGTVGLAYATVIEPARWYQSVVCLADQADSTSRQYLTMLKVILPDPSARQAFLESIGPELVVLLRTDPRGSTATQPLTTRPKDQASNLSLGMIVRVQNPAVAEETIARITAVLTGFTNLKRMSNGHTRIREQRVVNYHGVTIHRVPVNLLAGGGLWPAVFPADTTGEIAWVIADDYLLVSTNYRRLTQLIDLLFAPGKPAPARMIRVEQARGHGFLTVNLRTFGRYLTQRVDLSTKAVAGISQSKSRGKARIVLGVRVRVRKDHRTGKPVVTVAAVHRGYPAWGKLRVGDVIVGVDNVLLSGRHPYRQLQALLARKGDRDGIRITVEREGARRQVIIDTTPQVDMARTLRPIVGLIALAAEEFHRFTVTVTYFPAGEIKIDATLR